MESGVATLQQRLTETEQLAEDVLLCKDLLVDNDRQRNGCREALSALRRIERARQPQKHPQPPLRSPVAAAAAATTSSRGLSGGSSSSSSSQRLDAEDPAAMLRVAGVGGASTGSVSGSVSRDLLFRTASPARAMEAKKRQARVLVEELPDRRIVEAAADAAAPAGPNAAVAAPSSALAGEAASGATQELRVQQPEQQQGLQEGQQQQQEQEAESASVRRQQLQSTAAVGPSPSSWQSVSWGLGGCCSCSDRAGSGSGDGEGEHGGAESLWMAFPCSGSIGDGTYGIFFRAPTAIVKAQLQRDLEEFDGAAKSLRERQKSALDRVAEQNALAVGPSLVKAITSLKDGPPPPSTAAGLSLP